MRKTVNTGITVIPLILFMIMVFSGCSDEITSVGSGLISKENSALLVLDSVADTLPASQTTFKEVLSLGNSSRFLVGRYGDLAVYTLLKFEMYNSGIVSAMKNDSITVVSATMKLTREYQIGDTLSSFDMQAHVVNEFWDPFSFSADSLEHLSYNKADIISSRNTSDTLVTFSLDPSTVYKWMDYDMTDTSDLINHGMLLEPVRGINKVVGFSGVSYETVAPVIEVVYFKTGGVNDTLVFEAIYDVHMATGPDISTDPAILTLQSGVAYTSSLFFDVNELPKGAVINKAELYLTLDSTQSVLTNNSNLNLVISSVSDSAKNTYIRGSYASMTKTGNVYKADLTRFVAVWHAQKINEGIAIIPSSQIEGFEKFVLYGLNAPADKRPRLNIIYSVFN
ncbi:MAG: hypothetical protein HUU54_02885 [Ignavibacteriaceae bacterium]|nr:hypothetical protein [Ignavibacteriaceae bacterium]